MSDRDDHPRHPNLADALGADAKAAADLDGLAHRLAGLQPGDELLSPPSGVWAAIEGEIAGAEPAREPAPVTDLEPRRSRRAVLVALGSAAAVVLVVVGVALVARDEDPSSTTEQVALDGLQDFEDVTGSATVAIDGDARSLGVELSDVDVPPGSHLELWLLDESVEQLVPLGPLADQATHAIPDGVDLTATPIVDISLELDDGNPAHSGVSVARGRIEPS